MGHVPMAAWLPRRRWGRGAVLGVVALVAAAGAQLVVPLVAAERSPAPAPAASQGTWPAGLREAADAAIAADAYRFSPGPDDTWAATTPAQGLRANFGPAGPAVSPVAVGWDLQMTLARIGRPGALVAVEAAEVVGSAQGVEYRRGPALTEWYRNEARGLEQGFALAGAPAGAGHLLLELDTSGLAAALSPDGTEVLGSTAGAGTVLRYSGLEVVDATGRRLPASLGVEGQAVQLRVDDAGASYPLTVDPWFQQAKLTASDGAADDNLGRSVAVSGDTAVVGASRADVGANADAGSAYVFVRSGGGWTQQAKLTASDGAADDDFGISVAVSGDTAVVGADFNDPGLGRRDGGAAYVFVRSGTAWSEQAKLNSVLTTANDQFGISVAVSGDTAVVGAFRDNVGSNTTHFGAAYVFRRSGTAWAQQARLSASDGADEASFGLSVAVWGDTAVVGEPRADVGANADAGAAYVFVRAGTAWSQQAKLTASDGAAGDRFGDSVAASADTAVVGAFQHDIGAAVDAGSAYVFVRSGAAWAQQAKLTASDGAANDRFGGSVAVSADSAVIGAAGDDIGANADAGSAYVFVRSGAAWAQQATLTASDGAAGDTFGVDVALSGDTAVVGALQDDIGANANAGSAYVFAVDNVVPTCSYSIVAGPPKHIDFTVQDTGSGIASIAVLSLTNMVTPVPVPTFTVGTTAPLLFTATKDVQNQRATIAVVITDVAGNQSSCI